MTDFRDDINHPTAALGVGTSEGLEGMVGGWDFVIERKRGKGRAKDIEKVRKKVRESESALTYILSFQLSSSPGIVTSIR